MRSIPIQGNGDPGTFVYDVSNPTKYTEEASFVFLKMLNSLQVGGFELVQVEQSDIDSQVSSWHNFGNDIANWYSNAFTAYNGGSPIPNPPAAPQIPSPSSASMPSVILSVILRNVVRMVVDKLLHQLGKKLGDDSQKGGTASDNPVPVLGEIRDEITNLHYTTIEAFLDKDEKRFLDKAFLQLDPATELPLYAWLDALQAAGLTLNLVNNDTTLSFRGDDAS